MSLPRTIIIEPLEAQCQQCGRWFEYRPSRGETAQRQYGNGSGIASGWYCPDCHQDNLDDIAGLA